MLKGRVVNASGWKSLKEGNNADILVYPGLVGKVNGSSLI